MFNIKDDFLQFNSLNIWIYHSKNKNGNKKIKIKITLYIYFEK